MKPENTATGRLSGRVDRKLEGIWIDIDVKSVCCEIAVGNLITKNIRLQGIEKLVKHENDRIAIRRRLQNIVPNGGNGSIRQLDIYKLRNLDRDSIHDFTSQSCVPVFSHHVEEFCSLHGVPKLDVASRSVVRLGEIWRVEEVIFKLREGYIHIERPVGI